MALRRFELDDILNRPGTYFNPHTEVLIVVDDSANVDNEIFAEEELEDADWILVSDEAPLDEHVRDELIDGFQNRHAPGVTSAIPADEDDEDEVDELEPDEDEDY